MALAKVLSRGQITLPHEVKEEAKIRPGDIVDIYVVVPGRLKVEVVPHSDSEEFFERHRLAGPIDLEALRKGWEGEAAVQVLGELE